MKIGFNPQSIVGLDGMPLVGRVTFYVHDSDVKATVYSMQGSDFVESSNPQLLNNAGRLEDTVFFDAAIIDVSIEKYVGPAGQMSADSADEDFEPFDNFETGFEMPSAEAVPNVGSVEALADVDTSVGVVLVTGYYERGDSPARFYVWDPQSTNTADGGYVVGSNLTDSGKWIMLWAEETIPCSLYGIVPGVRESNISSFLSYPLQVGSKLLSTSPVPRFERGNYSSAVLFSSTKTIAFDTGARFLNATFVCYAARVAYNPSYVANFIFSKQPFADSSWFRSVDSFWSCGAFELHQNATNFFTNSEKTSNTGVLHARISGRPIQMTGSGHISFTACEFEERCLSPEWYTEFKEVNFTDRWFASDVFDYGALAENHHVYVNANNCRAIISDFISADSYLMLKASQGATSIDLGGRTVSGIGTQLPFRTITNGIIGTMAIAADTVLKNCSIGSLSLTSKTKTLSAYGCTMSISTTLAKSITLEKCEAVFNADVNSFDTSVIAIDSNITLNADITRPDASDHDFGATVNLYNCTVNGGTIANNFIVLDGCRLNDCVVVLFPIGTDSLSGGFIGNIWTGSAKLRIVPSIDGASGASIYNVGIAYLEIKGNTFSTTGAGIEMPFWSEDMQHRFIKGCCTNVDVTNMTWNYTYGWVYQGNTGNCPLSYGGMSVSTFEATPVKTISFGSGSHDDVRFAGGTLSSVFVLPVMQSDGGSSSGGEWIVNDKALACTPFRGNAEPFFPQQTSVSARFPSTMYLPKCAIDKTQPNDMFTCYLGGSTALLYSGAIPVSTAQ